MIAATNATNITGFTRYLDSVHGNLFGFSIVVMVSIITFGALLRWGEDKAAMVALLMMLVSGIFMWLVGLMSWNFLSSIVVFGVLGFFFLFLMIRFGN